MSNPGFEVLASDIQTFVLQMLACPICAFFSLIDQPDGCKSFHKWQLLCFMSSSNAISLLCFALTYPTPPHTPHPFNSYHFKGQITCETLFLLFYPNP